jgi:hypothetical protein
LGLSRGNGVHVSRPLTAYECGVIGIHHSLSIEQLGEAHLLADEVENALACADHAVTLARDRGERGYAARGSKPSRRRDLSQSLDVAHRRLAEVPLVLAAEVRGVIVTDSVTRLRRVEILAEHQPSGLLKP